MTAQFSFGRPRGAAERFGSIVAAGLVAFFLAGTAMADVWRFAVIGDTRGAGAVNTPANPWVNTPVLAAMAKAISNDQAELLLVAGDLVYGNPAAPQGTNMAAQYAAWTNAMAPVYQAGIRVYPVRGNHESSGDGAAGTNFLAAFTNLPGNGPSNEVGLTYSFTHKNAFFAGLDQYQNPHSVNQAWLANQLALNGRALVFIFGHEPAVQVASSACLALNRDARDAFVNSLTAAGGQIYFCGHDHFYDHAVVTAPNGRTFRQLVVGSGGAPGTSWGGTYGANFGEGGMATNVQHVGFTNGYTLVTVSNFTVTVEWKGSADLATWQTLDTFQYVLPNPAVQRSNDYDGDGKSDFALYDALTGYWTILLSSRNYASGIQLAMGAIGWRTMPGDYDGDGKTDMAVADKTGTWCMLLSGSNNLAVTVNFGVAGSGAVPADYDGDGLTDLAYFIKATGEWKILLSDSQAEATTLSGPGFVPAPADFDGDGLADRCIYRESTGEWHVLLSGSAFMEVGAIWGGPGFQAVPGDYDGDGQADLGAYNKTTGEWRMLLSSSGYTTLAGGIWGSAAHKPVPGDYDGDGAADPMVYADAMADWGALLSGSGYAGAGLTFGGPNWAAVKSLWRENLVFMAFGDSITYGGGSSSDGPATGYPKLLETKLKQYYDGYFLSVNRGKSGEDTYGGVERFEATLDETNPDLVLLMEGTNDSVYGTPYSEIEENLRIMISIALNKGIPVIIATIPPVITNAYRDRSAQMERIMAFNPRIYQIAADFNIPVAPVFEAMTSVPGWETRLMDQPSANHPNDAGYRVVRDAFYTPVSAGLDAGQY